MFVYLAGLCNTPPSWLKSYKDSDIFNYRYLASLYISKETSSSSDSSVIMATYNGEQTTDDITIMAATYKGEQTSDANDDITVMATYSAEEMADAAEAASAMLADDSNFGQLVIAEEDKFGEPDFKGQMFYPVNSDVWVTAQRFQGNIKVHIRKYKKAAWHQDRTKSIFLGNIRGVCLSTAEFKTLVQTLPMLWLRIRRLEEDSQLPLDQDQDVLEEDPDSPPPVIFQDFKGQEFFKISEKSGTFATTNIWADNIWTHFRSFERVPQTTTTERFIPSLKGVGFTPKDFLMLCRCMPHVLQRITEL